MRFRLINDLKEESRGYNDGFYKGQKDFLDGLKKDFVCFGSNIYKESYKLGYLAGYDFYLGFEEEIKYGMVRKHNIE